MATDFYGYTRDVNANGQIATSEWATLSIGSRMSLVQSASWTYQQTVQPKYEAGSAALFWVQGQPSGTIQFSRAVGKGGFLSAFDRLRNSCGSLVNLSIGLDGGGACAEAASGGRTIQFSGGVAQSITGSFAAGLMDVTEGASMLVATMSDS